MPPAPTAPTLPPPDIRLRMVIDTDAAAEVDDQHAIALALLCPERFAIEGFVGTHFGDFGGPDGAQRSVEEIHRLLEHAGLAGRYPVARGSDPMRYLAAPEPSEGVDLLIDRARAGTPADPLYIVGLGAATNIASMFLLAPEVCDRVVVVWHARCQHWPRWFYSWNGHNDLRAARCLLESALPLIWCDAGTELYIPMAVSEQRIRPCGPLGAYLHDIRSRREMFLRDDKSIFDLADFALLLDPDLCEADPVPRPSLRHGTEYAWDSTNGHMLRVHHVHRQRTLEELFTRLAAASSGDTE